MVGLLSIAWGGGAQAQCDMALPATPAFPGPHTGTIELRLRGIQNALEGNTDPYAQCGVHNHAIFIGGGYIGAGNTTPVAFVTKSQAVVEAAIQGLLDDFALDSDYDWFDASTFRGFVFLDIENPMKPQQWHRYLEDAQDPSANIYVDDPEKPILLDHIIDGFNTRIAAARAKFPYAELVLFPHVSPHSEGDCGSSSYMPARIDGWEYAGDEQAGVPVYGGAGTFTRKSILEDLDYVGVQLYARYGPGDGTGLYNEATTKAFIQQGMEVAYQMGNNGTYSLPVLPILSFRIHNPTENPEGDDPPTAYESVEDGNAPTLQYVQWQVEKVREYDFTGSGGFGIDHQAICFWGGIGELSSNESEPQSVEEFLDALFSPCDLNGDGSGNGADESLWTGAPDDDEEPPTNPYAMAFDMNGDRLVTTAGAGNDSAAFGSACGE